MHNTVMEGNKKKSALRNVFLCPSVCLPLPFCLFGSSKDLGGCTVCHLASETDTKSFGCDLFELMVQNIVSTPTPRGNFVGALGRNKWPMVYLHGQHTHARPTHMNIHSLTRKELTNSHLSPYLPSVCPAEAVHANVEIVINSTYS